jgi:hypothetical protein
VRRDREHLILEPLDLALRGYVTEDDDAAAKRSVGVVQWRGAEAEGVVNRAGQLDLDLLRLLHALQAFDHRPQGLRRGSTSQRPLVQLGLVEWLAEDDAGLVKTEQLARCAVQAHHAAIAIDGQQCVGHIGQDGLELRDPPPHLGAQPLRVVHAGQNDRRLARQGLDHAQIVLVVGIFTIRLHAHQANRVRAQLERHRDRRLG